jgi:Cu2+-exporting ATPase
MPSTDRATKSCIHCGTPFRPTPSESEFCCSGCRFVHGLIVGKGLGQFYELQEGGVFPVRSTVFQKRDYRWLSELAGLTPGEIEVDLQGISCIGCVWLIEKIFEQSPGGLDIAINASLGRITMRYDPARFDPGRFAREIQGFGYLLGPPSETGRRTRPGSLAIRMGLCAAFALNAMLFSLPGYLGMERAFEFAKLFEAVAFGCATLSLAVGGSYFFGRSLQTLRRGMLHIDFPISLGLIGAYGGSVYGWIAGAPGFLYFDFVSIFTFLMLVGRWAQQVAVEKNRNRLLGLQASVKRPRAAERFEIEPGEIVPVRAKLLGGEASLGMDWISGESEARAVRAGYFVPSGAINLSGRTLELEAAEDWSDSLLAKLMRGAPVERRQSGVERFLKGYLFAVLATGVAGWVSWWFATGSGALALQVLVSVLVVSCPCAAGVALPLADELAVALLRRHGVFVREESLWARLIKVRKVLFDKTGTLTLETMALKNREALDRLPERPRQVLAALVNDNLHPVSCSLREHLMASGATPSDAVEPREVIGMGLEAETAEGVWRLGRPGWAGDREADGTAFTLEGCTIALFAFGEQVRDDAVREVAKLRRDGRAIYLLSGDRPERVAAMAGRLGVPPEDARGAMTPEEKAAWVDELDRNDTLMVGDGANDSLAFDRSWCTGTPAIDRGLLEQKADFYFLGRGLAGVVLLFDVAARHRLAGRWVIGFAIAYNLAAVTVCLSGRMNPLIAAIIMPISSLVSLAIVSAFLGRPTGSGRVAE